MASAEDTKAKGKEEAEDGCGGDMGCGANMKAKKPTKAAVTLDGASVKTISDPKKKKSGQPTKDEDE